MTPEQRDRAEPRRIRMRATVVVGWVRAITLVGAALCLYEVRLARLWLWLMQPVAVIAIHIEGATWRVGPLALRRWSLRRVALPQIAIEHEAQEGDDAQDEQVQHARRGAHLRRRAGAAE